MTKRPMTRFAVLFAALLALAAPARAAGPAASGAVPPSGPAIDLSVNEGQLVRLSKPVNSVFIANPAIADVQVKSPSIIYVIGKTAGATTLYAVSDQDEVVLDKEVRVRFDAARVEQAIHELQPQSGIVVNTAADSLVLTGTVYSASEGDDIRRIAGRFVSDPKQLINKMKVDAPNQVTLRVRVAEVDRDVVKQFGINLQNSFNNGSIAFGIVSGAQALINNTVTSTTGKVVPTIPNGNNQNPGVAFNTADAAQLGGATNNNLFAGVRTGSVSVNSLIDALDNHGLVTILAEPSLTAISGEPASFLAGGEFPVPVPAGQGLVGIDWKKFGVSLNFVATVLGDDRIGLHVAPEVSELSNQGAIMIDGISVPSLTSRQAETTVELASGQTFAIAGLLQNNVNQNINKFPWLGDIPVLGQLFRSEAFQRNESELVILVTPYLVHPIVSASRAQVPTDGYVPSTDGELVLHADEYQPHAAPAAAPVTGGTKLIGPVGFDLE